MQLRREIPEYTVMPPGYGIAWRRFDSMVFVCYPIPLNVVVRWAREAYLWVAYPQGRTREELAYLAGFESGRLSATERAYRGQIEGRLREIMDGWRETVAAELRGRMEALSGEPGDEGSGPGSETAGPSSP